MNPDDTTEQLEENEEPQTDDESEEEEQEDDPELDVKGNPITEDPKADGPVDHEYTDEIVCPYCGHEHSDSWEVDSDGRQTCHHCDREFDMERDVSVTYRTCRIDRDKEAADLADKLRRMAQRRAECDAFTPGMRVRIIQKHHIHRGKMATVTPRRREARPDEHTFVEYRVDGVEYRGDWSDIGSPGDLEIVTDETETPSS